MDLPSRPALLSLNGDGIERSGERGAEISVSGDCAGVEQHKPVTRCRNIVLLLFKDTHPSAFARALSPRKISFTTEFLMQDTTPSSRAGNEMVLSGFLINSYGHSPFVVVYYYY